MKTLYDILQIPREATLQQVQNAYLTQLAQINTAEAATDSAVHLHAVKEAYYILSSVPRRQSYDAQLRHRQNGSYQQAAPEQSGWRVPVLLALLLTLGSFYYYQQKAQETTHAELVIARAEAKARKAHLLALEHQPSEKAGRLAVQQEPDEKASSGVEQQQGTALLGRNNTPVPEYQ